MNDVLSKKDIQKRGRLFVLYMGLAAFAFTFVYFGVFFLAVGYVPVIITSDLALLFSISLIPALVSIFASFVCWHVAMKNGVTRKKATKVGRLSVVISYVILGLIAGLVAAEPWASYTETLYTGTSWVIRVVLMTASYAVSGIVLTGLAAIPIGHYIGVIITPESLADRLAAYRKEKYAWRKNGD